MAAVRLALLVFLLITTTANTTPTMPYGECDSGNGGDVGTAVSIKQSLILDLIDQVPRQEALYYCNKLTLNGLQMFGFAECTRHGDTDEDETLCKGCLPIVGQYLITYCDETGAGHAWDTSYSDCYVKVGFSEDVCPVHIR